MTSEAISEHLISKNFLGEHAPRPPYSCMLMQIRHPCNPPSKNPGYGPADNAIYGESLTNALKTTVSDVMVTLSQTFSEPHDRSVIVFLTQVFLESH